MSDAVVLSPAERQRAATRQSILDAALRMLREEPATAFSHETVAARAAVAARTVYRHFPARSDLTRALWEQIRDTTGTRWPRTEAAILPALRVTFGQFDEHEALTRAVISAAANTGHPVHGSAEGRAAFREALTDLLAVLPADEGDRLVATCLAIYSAPFWQMLRDRGQLSAAEAGEAGAAAMEATLGAARARAARLVHPRSASPR
jgi:AcrR family transcriptional regulator